MQDGRPTTHAATTHLQFNAYSPAEIKEAVEKVGVKKIRLPLLASFMLAMVAGGSVGLGALYYTIVASDQAMSFAAVRLLGGLTFSLGLALVIVGGAELFTGNNLIVMAWASGKVSTREMLRNWVIVYFGNLVGSLALLVLVFFSHHLDMNGGRIGLSILNTAVAKIQPDVKHSSSRVSCAMCSSAWRFGLHMRAGRLPTRFSLSYCRSPPL
jgi:Formate/nitrite family of transporters